MSLIRLWINNELIGCRPFTSAVFDGNQNWKNFQYLEKKKAFFPHVAVIISHTVGSLKLTFSKGNSIRQASSGVCSKDS